jgi:hypothetical protein
MKRLVTLLVLALLIAVPAIAKASAPDNPVKWSQPPEMVYPWGFDVESDQTMIPGEIPIFNNTVVADDWFCSDGLPVTDVHWWGSYLTDFNAVDGFRISIHADIPAEATGLPSRPGRLLRSYTFAFGDVNQTFYDFDNNDNVVYQYFVDLTDTPLGAFPQEEGTIYWLDIEAVKANQFSPYWGWHTATLGPNLEHRLDDAVIMFGYDPATGTYPEFGEVAFLDGTISLDMAFELTTVPEPSTIVIIAGALAGFIGVARRKIFIR